MSTKEKSTFNHFFKEDAEIIQDVINGSNGKQVLDKIASDAREIFPKIPNAKEVTENEFKAEWRLLRSFFRNGGSGTLSPDLSPVIMSPLYTKDVVGTDFPVWVADETNEGDGESCLSFKELLVQSLDTISTGENDAHILKENIDRIIHIANDLLSDKNPKLFESVSKQIFDKLEAMLDVSGDEVFAFNSSLKKIKDTLPNNGVLLPYSNNTSFQILEAAMVATHAQNRNRLSYDIKQLTCRLKDLLRIEREKTPNSKSGFDNSLVNFDAISSIAPEAGSESMGEERVNRMKSLVADLEAGEAILSQNGFLFVDELIYTNKNVDWDNLFGNSTVTAYKAGTGCEAVHSSFEKHIGAWTKLFTAIRIGEIEVENGYQADIHDDYFSHFNWENFSSEELNNCPRFILIADDVQLFDTELSKLSHVLASNAPVKIVAVKRDNEGKSSIHSQTELGALMLSHKNIFVAQSTSISPKYLFNGFTSGLTSFAPAFFNVLNVDEKTHENPYLWTSASVESRDFPGFTFNGILGTAWGGRFEVNNNPQAELQCPVHKLQVVDADGENVEMDFPFTFAELASLSESNNEHFKSVDPSYWSSNLVLITDYIENTVEDNIGKVPFIWMMNQRNELEKVAVTWSMVVATQERLDFWKFLQENSGINNYYVAQAIEETKAAMDEQQRTEIDLLKTEHDAEIQSVRDEESGKVMENLTSVLLNLDTSNMVANTSAPRSTPTSSSADAPTEAAVEEAPVAEEESMLSNDPYIDTALCTSCNECINMNGRLFNYNGDKMAYIADPKAGSFKELVEAAELCPVQVIHPGAPLDPNEADLDSLVERAEKFN
jgi:ferredoxin